MTRKIIIFNTYDAGGCGFYRVQNFVDQYQSDMDSGFEIFKTQLLITDKNILKDTYSIILQRFSGETTLNYINYVKDLRAKGLTNAKMFAEIDDNFYSIEKYNYAKKVINKKAIVNLDEVFSAVDAFRVSTYELARFMENKFHKKAIIIKNCLPRWTQMLNPIKECSEIPLVLYTGATNHFSNDDVGDFTDWVKPIIDAVNDNKIKMGFFQGIPWFFKDIKDQCYVFQFQKPRDFLPYLLKINPDFIIAPLKKNYFNMCKSDIKLIESYAIGSVFIGSNWNRSPYEASIQTSKKPKDAIDEIINLSKNKEDYINRLKQQRNILFETSRFVKSPEVEF